MPLETWFLRQNPSNSVALRDRATSLPDLKGKPAMILPSGLQQGNLNVAVSAETPR
ncbi:MAG: hypothetical protein H7Z11_23070 [Verrucomicrobia bacterium]|nr:hypothetical protein [Leptolyngbya sp. ES-bin-22]